MERLTVASTYAGDPLNIDVNRAQFGTTAGSYGANASSPIVNQNIWFCTMQNMWEVQFGISMNGDDVAVEDSFIDQISWAWQGGRAGSEAVGIAINYSSGPGRIVNNFIASDGINIIFGGSGNPAVQSVDNDPANFYIANNYLYKAPWLRNRGVALSMIYASGCTTYVGNFPPCLLNSMKGLREQKNGDRIEWANNIFENSWPSLVNPYFPFLISPRMVGQGQSAQGVPGMYETDIYSHDNITIGTWAGSNLTSADSLCVMSDKPGGDWGCNFGSFSPQAVARIYMFNELYLANSNAFTNQQGQVSMGFLILNQQLDTASVNHITSALQLGVNPIGYPMTSGSFDGVFVSLTQLDTGSNAPNNPYPACSGTAPALPLRNAWITNSAMGYGYNSGAGCGVTWVAANPSAPTNINVTRRFAGNILPYYGIAGGLNSSQPPNYQGVVGDQTPFYNFKHAIPYNYHLNVAAGIDFDYSIQGPSQLDPWINGTPQWNTTDGSPAGVNWTRLKTAITPALVGSMVVPITYTVQGTVSNGCTSGVTINYGLGSVITGAGGSYIFTVNDGTAVTITPSLAGGYTFTPSNISLTVSGANVTGQNFSCTAPVAPTFSISGTITGATGVTMTLTPGNVTQIAAPGFTFTGLAAGSYTLTPSLTGYTFTPPSSPATITNAPVTGVNFTASPVVGPQPVQMNVGKIGPP
jgi:hypothetical protein